MENDIKRLLENEIESEIKNLADLEPGSKEHAAAVSSLETLYRLNIDETEKDRAFREKCDRDYNQEREFRLKDAQLKEQVKDRYIRLGLETAGLVLPLIFYATWMKRGFKFEETGTYTSTTFRGLFNRFRPTK